MRSGNLTPPELTFQSFRHSQGSMRPQLMIFNYMRKRFNVAADLRPNGQELRRYESYLQGAQDTHLRFGPDAPAGPVARGIYEAFKSLRHYWNLEGKQFNGNHSDAAYSLLAGLLVVESWILGNPQPWVNAASGKSWGRAERVAQRVGSGKSSFLYYYGRDAHSTGFQEFDTMYRDIWEYAEFAEEAPGNFSELYSQLETHRNAVFDAEIAVLGKTALAH